MPVIVSTPLLDGAADDGASHVRVYGAAVRHCAAVLKLDPLIRRSI